MYKGSMQNKKLSPTQLNCLAALYNVGGSGDGMLLSIYRGNWKTLKTLLDRGFVSFIPYGRGAFRITKEGMRFAEKNCPLKEGVRKVCKPTDSTKCWSTIGETFMSCSKDRRDEHLTCWHHRNWEEKAQDWKRHLEDRKKRR